MPRARTDVSPVGRQLRRWRAIRNVSQLELGLRVDVSARHISFVETGRAEPSREMLLRLADGLDLPLSERNALLTAGGFAPVHPSRGLDDRQMDRVREVLERLLSSHEPYPALCFDARWDVVQANFATFRLFAWLGVDVDPTQPPNLLWALFDPDGLRPHIVDWPDAARVILRRIHREVAAQGGDDDVQELIARVLAVDGVPTDWQWAGRVEEELPFLTFTLQKDGQSLSWLSTITTFGSPQDVTLQRLQIESFFPADETTEARWREICEG